MVFFPDRFHVTPPVLIVDMTIVGQASVVSAWFPASLGALTSRATFWWRIESDSVTPDAHLYADVSPFRTDPQPNEIYETDILASATAVDAMTPYTQAPSPDVYSQTRVRVVGNAANGTTHLKIWVVEA